MAEGESEVWIIILVTSQEQLDPGGNNFIVPAKHSPGKDNACYSSPTPAPNVGLPWRHPIATQYFLDAAVRRTCSAEMMAPGVATYRTIMSQ